VPRTDWGWNVSPEELQSWIIYEDDALLAVDKPAHLVCHPSKKGPWSSLIGACREYLGSERLHMVSRLDRETSGVVVIAKHPQAGRLLQKATQERAAEKIYAAILEGTLHQPETIEAPISADNSSAFVARRWIITGGQPSITKFIPIAQTGSYTLAEIHPLTGRRHQIRVHAAWMGHPILGDKLYGPDQTLMFRFINEGCTPDMLEQLKLDRHALHAYSICFPEALPGMKFLAPFPRDITDFWAGAAGALPARFGLRRQKPLDLPGRTDQLPIAERP